MSNPNIIIYLIDYFKTLDRKAKRNLLPRHTGYYGQNLRFGNEYGTLEKRLSRSNYNEVGLGSFSILGLYRYYKNSTGSAALLCVHNGNIKIGYDADGVFSNIKTGVNSTNLHTFLTFKDLCYIYNGVDDGRVFALISKTSPIESMGVPSAATNPSAVISAAVGNLGNGNYYYAISFQFDGYQEGNVNASSVGVNPILSQITLTIPTSANSRCTDRYLYRTKSAASIFYRLATVGNNTALTYVDNIADTSLDTTITAPTDYGVPGVFRYSCLHKERIFLFRKDNDKSLCIYSDIRNNVSYPDVFPANNYFYVSRDDGDEGTGIFSDYLGQLILLKENSVALINTSIESDISWAKDDNISPQGNIAPASLAVLPFGAIWLTRSLEQKRRLVLWNGQVVKFIPELEGLEPVLSSIPETALDEVVGHYQSGNYYLAYRESGIYNDNVLVINTLDWSWSVDRKNVACFASWLGGNDTGEIYTGASDNTAIVRREDSRTSDLFFRYKSDLDEGTFSTTQSLGTEALPSLGLTTAVNTQIGAKTWAQLSNANTTWADYASWNECWFMTGQWYSAIEDISAAALNTIFWNENNPGNAKIVFWVRTAETEAGILTAAWSGPYSTPAGTDISGAPAAKYIQVLAQLFVRDYADYDKVSLYRSGDLTLGYVIKVSSNAGTPAETTIEFDFQSGRIDLGDINEAYKRLRKRIRSVKLEYDSEDTTNGSLTFNYYLNGSTTSAGGVNTSYVDFPRTRIWNFPLGIYCDDFSYELYSNSDNKSLKIKKVIFCVSLEPLSQLK